MLTIKLEKVFFFHPKRAMSDVEPPNEIFEDLRSNLCSTVLVTLRVLPLMLFRCSQTIFVVLLDLCRF